MKKIVLSIFLISLFSGVKAQNEVNRLSLEDVIYLAQQQAPDALIAKHRFRSSYWQYRSFKAKYLPALNFWGQIPNYNKSINQQRMDDGTIVNQKQDDISYEGTISIDQRIGLTGGTFSLNSDFRHTNDFLADSLNKQYTTTPIYLSYTQPIFKFNEYRWEKKTEPMLFEEAQRKYLEDREQVALTAINYFFDLLIAKIDREIATKNYHNYDTLYNIAKGRFNLGKIAENDLLQLELNLLRAEASVDNAQLNYENMLFRLKSFLRIQDGVLIELIPPNETFHFDVDVETAISEAINNTSTALAFDRRMLEANANLARAKMQGRFDADLSAVFGLSQSAYDIENIYQNPAFKQDLQRFSLSLQIPILDWGQAKGQIKMAESSLELIRTSIEQEKIDFEQNIFLEVMQFNMQKKQLHIAAKADTVAQKRFDVTQKRYMIGKVNDVLELNQAQIDNDNSKQGYFQSLKTYWMSYYDLRKMTLFDFQKNERIEFDVMEVLQ